MDLVSIIMPCYNMEKYLHATIETVKQQTYPAWELLIVDDASTDDSRRILTELAAEDNRIKAIFLGENGGIANARNKALAAASGRYIAFLDSDDFWQADKLEKQIAFMKEKRAAFSYSAFRQITEEGGYLADKTIPPTLTYNELLRKNRIGCLTVVIDRELTGEFRMPNVKHEDYATWLELLRTRQICAYGLEEALATYNVRKGSTSRNKLKSMTWVYNIYVTREKLKPPVAAFYLLRWMLCK